MALSDEGKARARMMAEKLIKAREAGEVRVLCIQFQPDADEDDIYAAIAANYEDHSVFRVGITLRAVPS